MTGLSRDQDAGRMLARALARVVPGAAVVRHDEVPWASATFVGTRHLLRLDCGDAEAAGMTARTLEDADFGVRGHLVAEIVARAEGASVAVEILTLVAA